MLLDRRADRKWSSADAVQHSDASHASASLMASELHAAPEALGQQVAYLAEDWRYRSSHRQKALVPDAGQRRGDRPLLAVRYTPPLCWMSGYELHLLKHVIERDADAIYFSRRFRHRW